MAPKTRKLSSLIESQLPGFIINEYDNFSKFIEKYYEQQESFGQPVDIITNLSKYRDIDTYEKNLLQQSTSLVANIAADADTLELTNAISFPEENGYIKIGEEILFYQSREGNVLSGVSRGVSGNTTLGDLYNESRFVTTSAAPHYIGDVVYNISNLFLYALVKEFEKTYLSSFPEAYLKEEVDKRLLIKNITKFYKAKGTNRSVKFIFNAIVSKDSTDVPEVMSPKDYTLKSSVSGWVKDTFLKVRINNGDPKTLIGKTITQNRDPFNTSLQFASAVVDNVIFEGSDGFDDLYRLIVEPSSINGEFGVAGRSTTTSVVDSSLTKGDRISVKSTMGFPRSGKLLIGDEVILYSDKTVNQFVIEQRLGPIRNHASGKNVYSYIDISSEVNVKMISLGMVYNLRPSSNYTQPYSVTGERVEVTDAGFETLDPIVWDDVLKRNRWFINTNTSLAEVKGTSQNFLSDVGALFQDEQYYYIASSSFPDQDVLSNTSYSETVSDQKNLKLIRKNPSNTTEIYKTSDRDVGIFLDGVPALSYRDNTFIKKGPIETVSITNKGSGYQASPFVLVNEKTNLARCTLAGSTIDTIEILTNQVFETDPDIRITSGEGGVLSPVVTNGAITSMDIVNAGRYYSSPPIIRIVDSLGKGGFAEYEAVIGLDGSITEVRKISAGRFYTSGRVIVQVEAVGKNASATCEVKKWVYNRYEKFKSNLDSNNGTVFPSFENNRGFGYGYVANPDKLRERCYLNSGVYTANKNGPIQHSPILGFAYDGNPIYGTIGFTDPTNPSGGLSKLSSGYSLKSSRPDGPDAGRYPLGSFIDDYEWIPSVNSGKTELDPNNGRYCVTPEYPEGTYAYFITVDSNEDPTFPYILGENFYSLPVDSNYNSKISQDDIPLNVKALRTNVSENNGRNFLGSIKDVKSGNVNSTFVESSRDYFSPGNEVFLNEEGTGGSGAVINVQQVTGKTVSNIESDSLKAVKLNTIQPAYFFEGDSITQVDANGIGNVSGQVIRDVVNENEFVLRSVSGATTFQVNEEFTIQSDRLVQRVILDTDASFTIGSTIRLTDDDDNDIATGIVLQSTNRQNSLIIKVDTQSQPFSVTSDFYLRSSTLSDTNRAEIVGINSLSSGIQVFAVDDNIAIVETSEDHKLGIGDRVDVTVLPDDGATTTTYYVRKRLYQNAVALPPEYNATIEDQGVGSFTVLNSGRGYVANIYQDVELIFQDSTKSRANLGKTGDPYNAKATVEVSILNSGSVVTVTITDRGRGYRKGDVLTIKDSDLDRSALELTSARFAMEVDHVGFASINTLINVSNTNNVSREDFIQIGPEILKVTNVDVTEKTITVERGQQGTTPTNHFFGAEITSIDPCFRFDYGFRPFGEGSLKPYLEEYDKVTQEFKVAFDYSVANPQVITQSSTFFDNSVPRKLVQMKTVQDDAFNLEFSTDNVNFTVNPIIDIQKYYRYTFDVSHISMRETFLDFSASANYNLFTEEKETSGIAPGNAGSFVTIKLGFGSATYNNAYDQQQDVNFQNYFYFIRVSPDVDTSGSYLRIIDDPLAGPKVINYVTDTKFVYSLDTTPAYDGSGSMTYITSSPLAVGSISSLRVVNNGENYNLIPTVKGILPSSEFEADVNPVYDPIGQKVIGFEIISGGSNYSKPVAVVTDGDGVGFEYDCFVSRGKVTQVRVLKEGSGFTFAPTIRIIESDVTVYLESDTIGVPKNVTINNVGRGFNADSSLQSSFKSPTTFILRNISHAFFGGEKISQPSTGAIAYVINDGYRQGSNLLKVVGITGVFKNGLEIKSALGGRTATLHAQLCTEFDPEISPIIDNNGSFVSDRGKLSSNNQKLQDSYYFQDYSYVLRSKTSIEIWRDLIKETTHPAGFQLFGEMVIDSNASAPMPVSAPRMEHYSVIELNPVTVSILQDEPDTYKRNTITVISTRVKDLVLEDGIGSVSVDTFDTSETRTYKVSLSQPFDGKFDPSTGQLIGTKGFTLIDQATNNPLVLDNPQQLFVTLDGVIQEPGVSYTINGSTITFAVPPFGERLAEGQEVPSVKFYGRAIKFKNSSLNSRYFKKLKSIGDLFDGVQFEFDLYYEDGSIVKTDNNENLIVGLNGVVQKARKNETEPFGNSYAIIRDEDDTVTDKIRFSKPPIDNEDLYGPPEEIPEELKTYEKCFIYSIGSYERLSINSDLYEFRFAGPYLIEDEVTRQVRKVDDSSYALVFIDGVLQRETESYTIVGPNITFTKPLTAYVDETGGRFPQDVNIILMYGRDVPRTLTFYDFEPNTFNNTLEVTISGTGVVANFIELYDIRSVNQRVYWEQGDTIVGVIKQYRIVSPDELVINFANPRNVVLNSTDSLAVCDLDSTDAYGVPYKATLPGSYTLSSNFKVDDDGDRVLERSVPQWLYGLAAGNRAWNNKFSMLANLIPGDRILIDGESKFRTVTQTPDTAKTTTYRDNDIVQRDFYAKAEVTDYNGDTEGVGLSITANLSDGRVQTLNVSDIEWNTRDLQLYFDEGILLQPTAYEYYTTPEVHFIPVNGEGGGASAEVIAVGGQILDVVLTSGGSGYTLPPKVVVARRYKRIKENSRKVDTLIKLGINSIRGVGSPIGSTTEIIISGDGSTNNIFSIITFGGSDANSANVQENRGRVITSHVETLKDEENLVRMTDEKFPTEARVQSPTVVIDYEQVPIQPELTHIVGGVSGFEIINTVKSIGAEELTKIIEIPAIKAFRYQERTESINGVGTFLDAPLSETDTIVYVPNTNRFPDTPSRIRIGREVLFYRQKKEDRFLNVLRGHQGTIVSTHQAGDLVLHDPEFVTLLSGGVNEIQTIVSSAQSSVTSIEKTSTIIAITEVVDVDVDAFKTTGFQLEIDQFENDVIEQITIIPPTSYNIVTEVHSTTSRLRPINAAPADVAGLAPSEIVTLNDIDLDLTKRQQIQIVPSANISSITIGSVAATAASTSQVVTTSYVSTVHTHECAIDVLNTVTNVSVEIIEDLQSTFTSLTSTIGSLIEIEVKAARVIPIETGISHGTIYSSSEVSTSVQDVDTFVTTFSMIVGGRLGETGGTGIQVPYKFSISDYIIEEYVLENQIKKRDNTYIILSNPYNEVVFRNGSSTIVENRDQNVPPGFEDYTLGNVGLTLGSFQDNALIDSGISSGLSISDVNTIYPTLTIRDFDFREKSALLGNGDRFNLGIPTYQQPVAISGSTGTIGGPIVVQSTEYFADEGYLFTESGNVIQYTAKTPNTFENCTLVRGPNSINANDEIIPFSIV